MIERNRARKVWQFTRDPSDKRVLNKHSEQNTQEGQSLPKQDLGGRTSSSRPRRRIPLGNVERAEEEEVPSLRP
ncbi:hypothetical protein TNCV_3082331 [Trichonephila clavipes]|nr:hypothetical protein TNCV_3082331 [Trichonephila clavipes]